MFYAKDYPNNYSQDEKLCFDEIRHVAAAAGAGALVVENNSGYVLAEVTGPVTDKQKEVAKEYNKNGHILILDFVSDLEKSKGDVFHV